MRFENLELGRMYYFCTLDGTKSPAVPVIQTLVYLGYFETEMNSVSCETPYHWYQFSHFGQNFPCVSVPSRKQLEMNYYETLQELQIELNRFRTPWGMIERYDVVVLLVDIPTSALCAGDVGTVMYVHRPEVAYEVDFINGDGRCVASLNLKPTDVRKWHGSELLHARQHQADKSSDS